MKCPPDRCCCGWAERCTAPDRTHTNDWRFGTFASYSLGWLRQEENHYLNVPPDLARTLSPELRRIVGYQIVDPSLGFADTNADLLA